MAAFRDHGHDARVVPVDAAPDGAEPVTVRGEAVAAVQAEDRGTAVALGRALEIAATHALDRRDVAREALDRYRELNLLYRVSTAIGASLDPASIVAAVLAEAARAARADAAAVVTVEDEAVPKDGRGDAGLAAVLPAEAAALVADVVAHDRADIGGATASFASLVAVPLHRRGRIAGALVLGRAQGRPGFTAGEEKLLGALAGQAEVALERASLHEADAQRQRMEQELAVARRIQLGLLPRSLPVTPGWDIAAAYEPAREVGGDIYDCFPLPDSSSISLLVADVTGKGVPAALVMATARALLRNEACAGASPADVLEATNRALLVGQPSPLFLSALQAVLDVGSGRLRFANAGHEPPILVRASGQVELLEAPGAVLGAYGTVEARDAETVLGPGDVLALYTDGVTEARDEAGAFFGEERLVNALVDARARDAAGIVAAVRDALAAFVRGAPAFDDVTLLVLRREP